jgi:Outer membrane protein beta-barrel family/Carboxypeptidase regulatory-like domain
MKPILTTLLCCFSFFVGHAQTVVAGSVTDVQKQALIGATVLLLNSSDSLLVKGAITAPNGNFRLEGIEEGIYFLQISAIGLQSWRSETIQLKSGESEKQVPQVVLLEKTAQIQEVQIVAKTPLYTQKVDRLNINVGSSAVNVGSNALAVLSRSPGVLVNKQSNTLSMSGKFGVIIMINGKVSHMPQDAIVQMLESMGADNIERIELIHTPPSNFDAEGLAGIINIVLKQTPDQGLNGNYSVNGGYGKREKFGAGMNFNYRKSKLNLYGSYDYKFNHNPQRTINYRSFQFNNQQKITDGVSIRKPDLATQNGRLGADIQLTKKTVIGLVAGYFDRNWDMHADNEIDFKSDNVLDRRVSMHTREVNRWTSYSGNFNVSHQFTDDKKLSFDADYVDYLIKNPSDYTINYKDRQNVTTATEGLRVRKNTPIQIGVVKLDYSENIKKDMQLEVGAKATRSLFDNDVRVEKQTTNTWRVDSSLTSLFGLTETVLAGYASLSMKLNEKTDVKVGGRYEHTDTYLGSVKQPGLVDRQYGNFFPTLYLSRKISETQGLNMSYSRRIFRPGFTQLAPYLIFYDPNTLETGNPALQPAFVDAIRADYRYKSFSFTWEFNFEKPAFRYLPFIDEATNQQVTQPFNNGTNRQTFVVIGLPFQPSKWWQMQNNIFAVAARQNMLYENQETQWTPFFAGMNTNQSFTLPNKWGIEVSGDIMSPNRSNVFKYNPVGSLNFSVQKKFEQGGSLSLSATDLFETTNWVGTADEPQLNLYVRNGYQTAERTFMLTYTNKFGNTKLRDARQRESGASDEMRRL